MGDESCIGHYYTQCFGLAKTQQSSSPQGLRSAVSNSLDSYLPGDMMSSGLAVVASAA
jgi:hypothetical protein